MYAAPLNSDRFFRKVFSNLEFAKRFLEALLGITIEYIERIPHKYKITDAAASVEFDFRCKINGQYIVLDMQQTYKTDVVKRFYVYQSANSCLQLETLPKKEMLTKQGKKYEIKDYNGIEPTVTLVWMVDDTLQFGEDSVTYALALQQLIDFIKNDDLWLSKDLEKICEQRDKILALLMNNTKGLDFLSQNKLIFAFQKNIINNPAFSEYKIWFEFAEATKNPKNKKQDFEKFKKKRNCLAPERCGIKARVISDFFKFIENIDFLFSTSRNKSLNMGIATCPACCAKATCDF